jgi:hypothetical protein
MKKILAVIGALVAGGLTVSVASLVPQAVEAGFKVN